MGRKKRVDRMSAKARELYDQIEQQNEEERTLQSLAALPPTPTRSRRSKRMPNKAKAAQAAQAAAEREDEVRLVSEKEAEEAQARAEASLNAIGDAIIQNALGRNEEREDDFGDFSVLASEEVDALAAGALVDIAEELQDVQDDTDDDDTKALLSEAKELIEDRDRLKCKKSSQEVYVRSYCRSKPGAKAAAVSPEEVFDYGDPPMDSAKSQKKAASNKRKAASQKEQAAKKSQGKSTARQTRSTTRKTRPPWNPVPDGPTNDHESSSSSQTGIYANTRSRTK